MQLSRKLYTRGSSFETTIPKPLLFSRDLTEKQLVTFTYDEEKGKWYLDFENEEEGRRRKARRDETTVDEKDRMTPRKDDRRRAR